VFLFIIRVALSIEPVFYIVIVDWAVWKVPDPGSSVVYPLTQANNNTVGNLAVLPSGDKTQPYKPTFLLNICQKYR
jgi:hypothetical protein